MRATSAIALALAAALLVAPWTGGQAADAGKDGKPDWSKYRYENASSCSNCHTQPNANRIDQGALDLVLLTESAIWRTHDKHAQAYAVLEGERGKKIAALLGYKDAKDVLKPEAGCLSCHAMYNLAKENEAKPGASGPGLALEDGVNCGGCHGPSSDWNGPHQTPEWRKKTARQKFDLGMRDLRDPAQRAEVCVSCHVGNVDEGKIVTHAMFAAGHPPLPSFEIVNFSRNEPQHWRNPVNVPYFNTDNKEIIDNYHLKDKKFYEVKFSLIGAVVAFRENMKLAHDRANPDPASPAIAWPELVAPPATDAKPDQLRAEFAARWPELAMAHSDCFACHHDLKYPGYRQVRGFGYYVPGQELIRVSPGRPVIRSWPLAPLAAACKFVGKKESVAELHKLLQNLASACNQQPFGRPADIRATTGALVQWSDSLVAALQNADYSTEPVRQLILDLSNGFQAPDGSGAGYAPDYETARLTVSMVRAGYEGLARNLGPGWRARTVLDTKEVLNKLVDHLNLEPYSGREQRLKVVLGMIAKQLDENGDTRFEKGIKSFDDYLQDIRDTDALKGLVRNDFLTQLSVQYTSKMFVSGILQPKIVDRLQQIDDEEEKVTLKDVSAYDPEFVRPLLKQFSEIIVRP
jgi:mono/diheme cytochrome c family protein